jgi:addiction module HigA family antidote
MTERMKPIHPGEHLAEYLDEYGVTQYRLAKSINVPARRINEIIHCKRSITADTALRLGCFFGMDARPWINLQARYDLEVAEDALAGRLDDEVVPLAA